MPSSVSRFCGGAGGGIEPAEAELGGFVKRGRGEALQNEVAGLPVGEPEALRVGGVEAVGVGQLAAVGGEAMDELLARGGGNGRFGCGWGTYLRLQTLYLKIWLPDVVLPFLT